MRISRMFLAWAVVQLGEGGNLVSAQYPFLCLFLAERPVRERVLSLIVRGSAFFNSYKLTRFNLCAYAQTSNTGFGSHTCESS